MLHLAAECCRTIFTKANTSVDRYSVEIDETAQQVVVTMPGWTMQLCAPKVVKHQNAVHRFPAKLRINGDVSDAVAKKIFDCLFSFVPQHWEPE